jgi:outer membrane receptor protein involved in Fe transport
VSYNLAGAVTSTQTNLSIESAHRTGVGVFTQADAQVARSIRLTGGLRVDTVHNANNGGFFGNRHVSNTAVAGLAGVTFAPVARVTMTAQVARGFRDPTLSDRFYRGPVGRGFIEGNPDLKPETSLQIDLGARYDAGRLRLSGAYYAYRITNLVEQYAVDATSFFFRNRGEVRLRGAEVEAQADLLRGVVLEVVAQASRGRDADNDTPIDDIAPRSVSLVVRHALTNRLASYLRLAVIAPHDAAGPSEVPTSGYRLLDAGASWRVSWKLELRGVMRNLLNEWFYSSAGPRWVSAPGRHGSVTLVVRF